MIRIFKLTQSIFYVFLLVSCSSIAVKTYNLESPAIAEQSYVKIVLISDLHSTIYGPEQSALIDLVKNINPDIIILSGDIYDDVVPHTGTRLLLSGISSIAPVFYVTGNHEYMTENIASIRKELVSFGVTILSDAYIPITVKHNEMIIAGIEDPYKQDYETPDYNQNDAMEAAFRELDNISVYKILVAHRPEKIDTYKNYSFDLVLSGHTHGGQVRLPPFINGLYAPHQGLFPKYGGGLYAHNGLTHIISRGLSVKPFLPRIFNPPELVVIIIENAE